MNPKIQELMKNIEGEIMRLHPTDHMLDEIRDDPSGLVLLAKVIKSYKLEAGVAAAVELYYDAQKIRTGYRNKERTEDPRDLTIWFGRWLELGEKVIKKKLEMWVQSRRAPDEAKWAYSQIGIGPVIAAGLACYIDINRAHCASSLWKIAGLAPGYDKRVKGQTIPYNPKLKLLCWKLGQSFTKVSGNPKAVYGVLVPKFKEQEIKRNEAGLYAEQAAVQLATKNWKEVKATAEDPHKGSVRRRLLEGKLSDGHLQARAERKAVKIFLAHYYDVACRAHGITPKTPYVESQLGHVHIMRPAA